ncbi:MAG: hypothetical protein ACOC9E_07165 [Chloroflexota bacterium]
MKKHYPTIVLVLIVVLMVVGCAQSWQTPIMGPDLVNTESAAVETAESVSRVANGEQNFGTGPTPIVVASTEAVAPLATPTEPISGEPASPTTGPAPTTQPVPTTEPEVAAQPNPVIFEPDTTRTTLEGVLGAGGRDAYVFNGEAQQLVTIVLGSVDVELAFSLSDVDSGKEVSGPDKSQQPWTTALPQTQQYLLVVEAPQEVPSHVGEIPYHVELTVEDLPFGLPPPAPELITQAETLVYEGPGRDFAAVHALPPQRRAHVLGRNLDNSWLAIAGPGDGPGEPVWVAAEDVVVEGDVHLAPILEQGS